MNRRECIAALLAGPVVRPWLASAQTTDLTSFSIGESLERISRKQISPLQLTNAYLARIEKLNPQLNAFITITAALARQEARRAERGPLGGIPIAHKDIFETIGIRTTAGSQLFDHYLPTEDAAIVSSLRRAGAIMLGKTNMHELGGGVTTINPFYGTSHNPIDPTRIAGGSSGGSAVAVAARMCAAATGSDTGGSVRIPAALCGCVGFKPTFGRLSTQGMLGACPTFDHVGFLTRTVKDAQLMFNAALGTTPGTPAPGTPALKIGVARPYFFDDLQSSVATAMNRALERMKASGMLVDDCNLPITGKTYGNVFDPIAAFEIWSRFGADWRANPSLFSPAFVEFFKTERPAVTTVESTRAALAEFQSAVDRVFDEVDVIVTPTVPVTAPPIAGPIDGMKILRNTWPFNAAHTPAISIPCGTDAAGLPVGLQLVARKGQDERLLAMADAIYLVVTAP